MYARQTPALTKELDLLQNAFVGTDQVKSKFCWGICYEADQNSNENETLQRVETLIYQQRKRKNLDENVKESNETTIRYEKYEKDNAW